jgi:uncharacterized membrane protein SpoIIM required for sporulation/ABC-type transport system involved in multi-copper enzyme maturation permease subunit
MLINAIRPSLIVAQREVRDQFRDWRIIFPVITLTLVFPFIMNWTAGQILDFVATYGAGLVGERLVPFLLMIVGFFPISVSLIVALDSFVGEKERGSIEPLLNSPLKDWQLYLGKLISSTVPPLLSSYLGMTVYLVGLAMNAIPWPEPVMLLQIFCLTTVQAFMMVSGAVVVSSQATSVRAANLLASFIIIPSAFLIQWESVVMFWGNYSTLWWVVFGILVLTVLLVRVGLSHFQREELLGREIDVLRLQWGWRFFRTSFTGNAHSLGQWYSQVLPGSVRQLRTSALFVTGIVIAGLWIGWGLVERFPLALDLPQGELNLGASQQALQTYLPLLDVGSVVAVFWQNLRVLVLAMLLGLFTFGVMGVFPLLATMAVAGYLLGFLSSNGIAVLPLVVGMILPHGIIEVPAAILATAAVLKIGAILASPTPGRTIGEVWLESLADWARLMLGVVVPLLLIAASIEVWVTPRIALLVLGN